MRFGASHMSPHTRGSFRAFFTVNSGGEVDENLHLVVALNGVVRTVVPVFDQDDEQTRFNAILPDEAFVAGYNDVELFAVSGPSERSGLRDRRCSRQHQIPDGERRRWTSHAAGGLGRRFLAGRSGIDCHGIRRCRRLARVRIRDFRSKGPVSPWMGHRSEEHGARRPCRSSLRMRCLPARPVST